MNLRSAERDAMLRELLRLLEQREPRPRTGSGRAALRGASGSSLVNALRLL
jgi:hypothetical protein